MDILGLLVFPVTGLVMVAWGFFVRRTGTFVGRWGGVAKRLADPRRFGTAFGLAGVGALVFELALVAANSGTLLGSGWECCWAHLPSQ